jgi:phosphate transport system substrate-binding protein
VKTAGYTIVFTLGSKTYTVNGASKTLLVAAQAMNGRTMIPLRALAESIGADVNYNASTKTAVINYFTKMSGSIKISGSTTVQPIAQAAADKLLAANSGLTISVAGGGSGTGIKETISGANNIGMSSRALTADESATLTKFVIANDGIALVVNTANKVKNLTREQAEQIFRGEITNWSDVGGDNAPILVQTRETGSGTLATLEELLLEKEHVVSTATPHASNALLKQAVAAEKNAIGFISVGYVDSTVKTLTLGNIAPTAETVSGGSYALSRSLYVFTSGMPAGTNAMFIDYLKSEACQSDIISAEGYIPIR